MNNIDMALERLPVAVIGAGPVGLAAAAHLILRGKTPIVFEVGPRAGTSICEWGHVRLFSPWRYMIDEAAETLLSETAWRAPDLDSYPLGGEFVARYLVPLANLPILRPHVHFNTRVVAVSRQSHDKMKTGGREQSPFVLRVVSSDGEERDVLAEAVIDASGTYHSPNPLGSAGLPALGERAVADRVFYGIPDALGSMRARYAGRRVLIVGSGHSAFNALLDLASLSEHKPATSILWAVRRNAIDTVLGGGTKDHLEQRGKLGNRVGALLAAGKVTLYRGVHINRISMSDEGVVIHSGGATLPPVDEIIATTGFRPDGSLLSELRLSLDTTVESPVALAPLIDPNLHSCGTVPPHGVEELAHPDEPGIYIVGMKSYGRAPTFLTITGYEQVRSIAAALAGDWEAARQVRLVLPETGVCSTDSSEPSCCGSTCEVSVAAPLETTAGGVELGSSLSLSSPCCS